MAKLKEVLPGGAPMPQTARRELHPVRMPNPFEGAGDGLGNLVRGGNILAASLGDMFRERDELDYRRVLNAAEEEASKRFQNDVLGSNGYAAEGVTERYMGVHKELGEKYVKQLNGRNAKRFEEEWGRRGNVRLNQAMGFERQETHKALGDSISKDLARAQATYTTTGDDRARDDVILGYKAMSQHQNGGRFITLDSVKAFDADLADGDDQIKLPDGRTLRIVDERKPEDRDVITREELKPIREKMVQQAEANRAGLQDALGKMYSARLDYLMKNGDMSGARDLVDGIQKEEVPKALHAQMRNILDQLAKNQDRDRWAATVVRSIMRGPDVTKTGNGQYMTDEARSMLLGKQSELNAKALETGDPEDIKKAETFQKIFEQQDRLSRQLVRADVSTRLSEIKQSGGFGNAQATEDTLTKLYTEPSNPVTVALIDAAQKQLVSQRTKDDEPTKRMWRLRSREICRVLSYVDPEKRKLTVVRNGKQETIDCNDAKQLGDFLTDEGFPQEEIQRINDYAKPGAKRYLQEAQSILAEAVNQLTGDQRYNEQSVGLVAPELVDRVLDLIRQNPALADDQKMMKQAITQMVADELRVMSTRKGGWLWDSDWSAQDYFRESVKEDGQVALNDRGRPLLPWSEFAQRGLTEASVLATARVRLNQLIAQGQSSITLEDGREITVRELGAMSSASLVALLVPEAKLMIRRYPGDTGSAGQRLYVVGKGNQEAVEERNQREDARSRGFWELSPTDLEAVQ